MAVTLGIYYLVPWIRWDRGPYLPDQAVLIDFPARRFYFFFLEIWPQEFYYITGLLVLASLALFLVTSVAGRVWCGYTCPQTVWTDLMIAVERFFQGDRNQRLRLDKNPWAAETLWRRGATHLTWLLIAIATGGAWVFYFADAPTLAKQLVTFEAPLLAYIFIGVFTATTYVLGGLARVVARHQHVNVAAALRSRRHGVERGAPDRSVVVFRYYERRHIKSPSLRSSASPPASPHPAPSRPPSAWAARRP